MRAAKMVKWAAPLAALLGACASASSRAHPRGAPLAPETPAWDAMTQDQKLTYMNEAVMPEMKSLFTTFDRHRYAKMGCETCHGRGGGARGWKMPNPDLLLEAEAAQSPAKHGGDLDRFMRERVSPEMARLLGRPAGFGCFGCHTVDR